MTGTRLDVRTADGVADCYTFQPAGAGPWPAVVFLIDALGVRPSQHEMAARFSQAGFFVLMPNVFYRFGDFAPFDPKTVWTDQAQRDRLMGMIHKTDAPSVMRDLGSCLDALAQQPAALAKKVGMVGYCMGGRLAFTASGAMPERVGAVACIHGGGIATDAPDSPHLQAPRITAQLYFGIADNDRSCTVEQQAELKKALDAAKVRYQSELYPGVQHGFAVPDFPVFDHAAAEKHYDRAISLFREALPKA
jgi:carboxymethylenebutenolidase